MAKERLINDLHKGHYVFINPVLMLLSRIVQKLLDRFFTKFVGQVAYGPWKKPLDFVNNRD